MGCFSTDFFRSYICGSVFFLRQLFLIRLAPVPHRIHDRVEAEAEFRQGIFDTRRYLGVNFRFIEGAFMGVASNWLFAARYEAMIGPSIAMLENTGFYTGDQIEMMMKLMRSPLVQLFSGMLASAIKGGFFGLFIAAFTKRDPDVFSEGTNQ